MNTNSQIWKINTQRKGEGSNVNAGNADCYVACQGSTEGKGIWKDWMKRLDKKIIPLYEYVIVAAENQPSAYT